MGELPERAFAGKEEGEKTKANTEKQSFFCRKRRKPKDEDSKSGKRKSVEEKILLY